VQPLPNSEGAKKPKFNDDTNTKVDELIDRYLPADEQAIVIIDDRLVPHASLGLSDNVQGWYRAPLVCSPLPDELSTEATGFLHVIWIAGAIYYEDPVKLIKILAHELQNYQQFKRYEYLFVANNALKESTSIVHELLPIEIESEVESYKIVRELYGSNDLRRVFGNDVKWSDSAIGDIFYRYIDCEYCLMTETRKTVYFYEHQIVKFCKLKNFEEFFEHCNWPNRSRTDHDENLQ
jgi:hypothetical protein